MNYLENQNYFPSPIQTISVNKETGPQAGQSAKHALEKSTSEILKQLIKEAVDTFSYSFF